MCTSNHTRPSAGIWRFLTGPPSTSTRSRRSDYGETIQCHYFHRPKLPSSRNPWRATIETAVGRKWDGWQVPTTADSTRVYCGLVPCQTCSRHIRVPVTESASCAGATEHWWGRWRPCTHTTKPTTTYNGEARTSAWVSETSDQPYVGRGDLTGTAEESLGCSELPDSHHMWRTVGPCADEISSFSLDEAFSKAELRSLANKGGGVIQQSG